MVKFNTRVHRDIAVAMLRSRSARFHEGDTAVWAQCDCEKNDIQIDDDYSEMKVGNEVVLQVFVENSSLQCRWCDTSSAWEDLQNSPEISEMQELGKRAPKTLSHMGKGAGKGGQLLYTTADKPTTAAGAAVLVHAHHTNKTVKLGRIGRR